MMRLLRYGWLFALLVLPPFGCRQRASKEQLGEVLFELPKIPGAQTPCTDFEKENPAVENAAEEGSAGKKDRSTNGAKRE